MSEPSSPAFPPVEDVGDVVLREPAHRVSSRAVGYWRVSALLGSLVVLVPAVIAYVLVPSRPWWATLLLVLLALWEVGYIAAMPTIRYRVHRWEVSHLAVHTRSGWLSLDSRIAPISRIQTVDSKRGALMRLFGLASLTVTTASAAGPITIDCLDDDTAVRLVTQLTRETAATEGDAT